MVTPVIFDPLLHSLPLDIGFQGLHAYSVVEKSLLHYEKSLLAADALLLGLVKVEYLLLLVLDIAHELVNVCLFFIQINLIILLILRDVYFLHISILIKYLLLEFVE